MVKYGLAPAILLLASCSGASPPPVSENSSSSEKEVTSSGPSDEEIIQLAMDDLNKFKCINLIVRENPRVTDRRFGSDEGEAIVNFKTSFSAEYETEVATNAPPMPMTVCKEHFMLSESMRNIAKAIENGSGTGSLDFTVKLKKWDSGWRLAT